MRILIIEDNAEFRTVAAETLGQDHELVFATTFMEAFEVLKANEVDGIISDLFFPASAEEPIGENGEKLIKLLEDTRVAKAEYWPDYQVPQMTLAECGEKLAPLGIQAVQTLLGRDGRGIVLFSQGDRHENALGFVRFSLDKLELDMMSLFVRSGSNCDKNEPAQWREAAKMLEPKTQLSIWQSLWGRLFGKAFDSDVDYAMTFYA